MNTYITWTMTLFALYIARRRRKEGNSEEIIKKEIHEFHMQSRTQSFEDDDLWHSIHALYYFMREKFNEDFTLSLKEWVVKDYDRITDIVIGHDGRKEITIDELLELIDTNYIIPEGITVPSPAHFKNLDLGGRSQIKIFLEKDSTELDKRNQFLYILTGGEFKDRIYGATKLHSIRGDIHFVAIDPRFETLFTMLSPLEALHNPEDELMNSLVVAAGSKDNHFGYYGPHSDSLRVSSILGNSVFKESHRDSGMILFETGDIQNDWYRFAPNFVETSAPSRIDKVWGAMMDIMSQRYSGGTFFAPEPDTEYPSDIRDSIKYLKGLRGCEWRPVEHIILAGNALFAFSVEKIRGRGVTIPLDCVDFGDKTLKRILKDKKQEIWESDAWDTFDWQLTHINKEMGESMIQPMIEYNAEMGRDFSDWFLDINIYIDEASRDIGDNLADIFRALEPYQFNISGEFCVKSIRSMPRVTPGEMTDEEIHRILGNLTEICGCLESMDE